jgi:hypothetical protein
MQVHVEDIARVESAVGDDKKEGTWVYLHGKSEPRYCLETADMVREVIEEASSKEEIELDVLALGLLLKAAGMSADGRLHFIGNGDGLTVAAGGVRLESLQGRDRSKYEHAEQQLTGYAVMMVESHGVYRLNERGYRLSEFLVANQHPDDEPFRGFVKLPTRPPAPQSQIGVQINQTNNNTGPVNNAISEKGSVDQSVK